MFFDYLGAFIYLTHETCKETCFNLEHKEIFTLFYLTKISKEKICFFHIKKIKTYFLPSFNYDNDNEGINILYAI